MKRTKSEAMETRVAILDAAEAEFFANGVSRTTLGQIAEAAKVTRGAIYFHFKNKNALFLEVVDRARFPQECFAQLVEAAASPDPLTQLEQCGLDALRFMKESEQAQRIMTIMLLRCEYVGDMEEVLKLMREADEEMHAVALAALENAAGCGLLAPEWDPQSASAAIHCQIVGLISEWLRHAGSFDIEAVGARSLRALFDSIGTVRRTKAATGLA